MSPALRRLSLVALLACACAGPPAGEVSLVLAGTSTTLTGAGLAELPATKVDDKGRVYTGARLRDVLARQGVGVDAPLTAVGADGYSKDLAPEALQRDDAILAYAVDGGPLGADEGPLRLVVANSPGLSVRRLVRLARE